MSVVSSNSFVFFDDEGELLDAGTISIYTNESATNLAQLYADRALTVSLSNPLSLNSAGGTGTFHLPTGEYFAQVREVGGALVTSTPLNVLSDKDIASSESVDELSDRFVELEADITGQLALTNTENLYVGEVRFGIFNLLSPSWLLLDGSLVLESEYSKLYSVLNGQSSVALDASRRFALPDMRGRFPVASGLGTGLTTRVVSSTGGAESVDLVIANMPTHGHDVVGTEYVATNANAKSGTDVKAFESGKDPKVVEAGGRGGDAGSNVLTGDRDLDASSPSVDPVSTVPPYFALKAYIYTGRSPS